MTNMGKRQEGRHMLGGNWSVKGDLKIMKMG